MDTSAQEGASRPNCVNSHFLQALQTTLQATYGNCRLKTEDVAETEQELKDMVGVSSAFVPIFELWPFPGVLTRLWCLIEFYHAIKQGKSFQPALITAAAESILAGFTKRSLIYQTGTSHTWSVDQWEEWTTAPVQLELVERVDLSMAEARFAEDKERIDRSVSEDIDFEQMNRAIRDELIANLYPARCDSKKAETFCEMGS